MRSDSSGCPFSCHCCRLLQRRNYSDSNDLCARRRQDAAEAHAAMRSVPLPEVESGGGGGSAAPPGGRLQVPLNACVQHAAYLSLRMPAHAAGREIVM